MQEQAELLDEFMMDRRTIKFGNLTRAINRDYEKNNNLDFDNGVYHKFAYKHQPHVERSGQDNTIKLSKQEVPLEVVYEGMND